MTIHQTGRVLRRADEKRDDVTWFRASTPDIDRHGTIIEPLGIKTDTFDTNPVFLWGHDGYGGAVAPSLDNVLGRVVKYERSKDAFDVAVRWATEDENPRGQMAKNMVRGGILNAVSIGFIPNEERITTRSIEGAGEIPVYEETELVEVSLVPIPANPNAVALVRSLQTTTAAPVSSPPADAAELGEEDDERQLARWATEMQLARMARRLRE